MLYCFHVLLGPCLPVAQSDTPDVLSLLRVRTRAWCEQIRLVEGRDRPIDRLAKNVLLFGQQDEGEADVSGGRMLRYQLEIVLLAMFAPGRK